MLCVALFRKREKKNQNEQCNHNYSSLKSFLIFKNSVCYWRNCALCSNEGLKRQQDKNFFKIKWLSSWHKCVKEKRANFWRIKIALRKKEKNGELFACWVDIKCLSFCIVLNLTLGRAPMLVGCNLGFQTKLTFNLLWQMSIVFPQKCQN